MKKIDCFVIMPIGDKKESPEKYQHFKDVYENLIKPSVEDCAKFLSSDIECYRADDIKRSGSIMKKVLKDLLDQVIVIADLSGQNPNVFYELGVRHTFFKRSILIADTPGDNPFDIYGYRTIPYKYSGCDEKAFRDALKGHIEDIIKNPSESDNPVWDFNLKAELKDDVGESKNEAKIEIGYKKIKMMSERHDYEFEFGITNNNRKAFKDIFAEIKFPEEYLEKKDWNYPHLRGKVVNESNARYRHFTFNYAGIREDIRRSQYDICLLPDHTLWVFGKDSPLLITRLPYFVTHNSWDNRRKYRVEWKIFADGKVLSDGSMPFGSLQMF